MWNKIIIKYSHFHKFYRAYAWRNFYTWIKIISRQIIVRRGNSEHILKRVKCGPKKKCVTQSTMCPHVLLRLNFISSCPSFILVWVALVVWPFVVVKHTNTHTASSTHVTHSSSSSSYYCCLCPSSSLWNLFLFFTITRHIRCLMGSTEDSQKNILDHVKFN